MGAVGLNPSTLLSGQGIDVSSVVQQIIDGAERSSDGVAKRKHRRFPRRPACSWGSTTILPIWRPQCRRSSDPTGALAALRGDILGSEPF